MMIEDYMLVVTTGLKELEGDVKERIRMGWQPFGYLIAVVDSQNVDWIVQPMVKYAPELREVHMKLGPR